MVATPSQKRALRNYRNRLAKRGLARFEVLGLNGDRDLIRKLAKRLALNDAQATRIRAEVSRSVSSNPARKGGILAALRASPLVGSDLRFERSREPGRNVEM
jgi:hypothetical protein